MRLRLALAVGGLAACAPAPEARAPAETRGSGTSSASYGIFVKRGAEASDKDIPPTATPIIELPFLSSAPRPRPPKGVVCAVFGRGTPRYARCGSMSVEVAATRSSDDTTAVVELRGAEFAWGFYRDSEKAWILVDDGTFIVDGFADPKDARFALRREVGAIPGHIWLKEGVAVRAMSADERGVAVALDDEIAGIEDVELRVPCDTLLFDEDRVAPPVAVGPTRAPSEQPEPVVYAAREKLDLHLAPGGERALSLGSAGQPLMEELRVLEERGSWVRVGFETDSARFDLWARESEVSDQPGVLSIGSSSCCGGLGLRGASLSPARVLETTRVIVGKTPLGSPTPSVMIRKGAEVEIQELQSGFAAILPHSIVGPPEGTSFWVPESMLVR